MIDIDIDTEPSYSFDAELDDELIRKALSSQMFTQEQEESANPRQTCRSHEEGVLPAQSLFTRTRTERPVYEPMEELQKSHVLKVEKLTRTKLTEDFEEVTSFFQDSNVKTVYNIVDNDAKYPDAEIDDEHNRNSLASLTKEKACFNVHSQFFLTSKGRPVYWMSQKRKSNHRVRQLSDQDHLWKDKEILAHRSKIRDPET